jgi:predicted ester cyclase
MPQDHAFVRRIYTHALTVNAETTPEAVLDAVLAEGFQSVNSQETKDKATFVRQVGFFWSLIPDLRWEPQDVVVSGDGRKVVVRGIASGSPRGNFMGLALDETKSFRIDSIDFHEIEAGRILRVHHLEDWATAMKQLRA